jgi:ADP-ribose pyrophosphatase YjhB (NUDIX family)
MAADLTSYPRPNVAVDLALLTAVPADDRRPGHLAVLMQQQAIDTAALALPGRFVREGERVVDTIGEVLRTKVGLDVVPTRPLLLGVFDDPARDPRAWTMSLAHALALPHEELSEAEGQLVAVDARGRPRTRRTILYDHEEMVRQAASALRERYERRPDPDGLLTSPFTLSELRRVHEAVIGEQLRRDTFNRRMAPHLDALAGIQRTDGGRPAQVYETRARQVLTASDRRRLLLPRVGHPR